jgi:hypothetical protein
MRKYFIVALVLAAGCDATRRDFSVCDNTYKNCREGFTCNLATGLCEPTTDASVPVDMSLPDVPLPIDVEPGEVAVTDAVDAPAIDVEPGEVQPIDGVALDVSIVADASPLDTGPPDQAGTCSVDQDCAGSVKPYCVNNQCVACRTSDHCSNAAGTPFCSAINTCVSCAAATGDGGVCSGAAPMCDPVSGRCVECIQNGDCPTAAKAFCVANRCVGCNTPGASASGSGGSDGGASDGGAIDAGVVGPCPGNKPICVKDGTLIGQCVQCLSSADCSGGTPICNANLCTECSSDSQCAALGAGPGVCMFPQSGRCVAEVETIYVKNSSSCAGGAGTQASPFCDTQAAVNAVTSSKRVIVVKGPASDTLSPITSTPSGSPISIIGQNGATFGGSGVVGIHVTAGDVYLRGIRVENGTKTGIVVEAGATLRLNRCIIRKNVGGGVIVQPGASFDIANSVFDDNGPGSVGPVMFGGVYLAGSAPTSGPSRFWFSTLVNNQETGVVCADGTQVLTGMLMSDNVGGGYLNCSLNMDKDNIAIDSKWDSPGTGSDVRDPAFSSTNPYHLTSNSPCRNFVPASMEHPLDDLDGDARPRGAAGNSDCGADE